MLHLHIGFPAGKYSAACIEEPSRPEWPPHPSRIYSALVAAAYASDRQPSACERNLLLALEQAEPPSLAFPEADTAAGATSYVPVNDLPSRFGPKSYGPLLPNRQPRHFPVAYLLGEPEIVLSWAFDLDREELRLLDQLAARMTHLGTSHSLVVARFTCSEPKPLACYAASPYGDLSLRVPLPGRLQELDEVYAQCGGSPRRPQPLYEDFVTYARLAGGPIQVHHSAYEWLAFRLKGCTWGADTAHSLGKSLRRAIMSLLDAQAPAAVHGHAAEQLHIAWLPLPEVGHPRAEGRIRGMGIALPNGLSRQERALTLAALARLPFLRLPDGQVAELEPVIDGPHTLRTLCPKTWTGFSPCWSSVTPVVLDRPPKRFESSRVIQALVESLVNAGFPAPLSVTLSQTSDFEGGPSVRRIPTRLPRTHARVVFAEPVQGPVIAGRWKYFGTGLFRPTPEEFLS
ncbi:type I-G CRISPR-associated protein Csb2 [Azotobacter chroococcum]|uniref:CRISPR-associated protein n=1 Tax=Azotobacter chroococcum NCIMB 8003 TaxID=1328314 RepID=A0A0C4WLN0_9GAMM|nr:type I-U CRISPR-associated protein Csb2 [Azotobacter chroococcum]AJE23688.1 CRISPR-associated protein [Azotobacter chroococcum NCIMB 8003]